MKELYLIFILSSGVLVLYPNDCEAQCSQADYKTWVPVLNESAYDRNPSSLSDPDGRPLGFQLDTLDYINDAPGRTPCVTVTGCINSLEFLVETDPLSMICIEDISSDAAVRESVCQERISGCIPCPSDEVTWQFSCQGSSCDQTSVDFWFRFVLSDPSFQDPELWCNERSLSDYPSSLIDNVPVPATRPPTTTPGRGVSLGVTCSLTFCALLAAILCIRW